MKKVLFVLLGCLFVMGACSMKHAEKNIKTNVHTISQKVSGDSPNAPNQQKAEDVGMTFTKEFFTLYGRENSSDIGGMAYVHPDLRVAFAKEAQDAIYSYLPDIIKSVGKDQLPEVDGVKAIDVQKDGVTINGKHYNAYNMTVVVTFNSKRKDFDTNNLQLTVANTNNTWQIVKVQIPTGKASVIPFE